MKTCTECREAKPLDAFAKHPRRRDRLVSRCRSCINRRSRALYHLHPERDKKTSKLWRQNNPELVLWYSSKHRARLKSVDFFISKEDISIPENCPCCGRVMEKKYCDDRKKRPSIDRVDNAIGYYPENIKVICYACNQAKSDATLQELKNLVSYMEKYLPK